MSKPSSESFVALKTVLQHKRTRRGAQLRVDGEDVCFDFVHPDVLRIKIANGGALDATPTFAVVQDEFGTPRTTLEETGAMLVLSSDCLRVEIGKAPFHIDVLRPDGAIVYRSSKDKTYRFLNDTWCVSRLSDAGDAYLGLGEKTGGLNHNGRHLQMWNTDILAPSVDGEIRSQVSDNPLENPTSDVFDPYYMSIPFYYHMPRDRGVQASGSFIDNGYHMHYDLSCGDEIEIMAEGGQYTEYVFAGPSIRDILARYTELTGRMPAPPRWALGHHQCRWHDYADKDLMRLARTYRRKDIPCDVLWLDIHYMDGYRVFTWNTKRFKNIAETLDKIRRQGFRVITIIDPGVKYEPGYPVFDEGQARNLFCKTESGQTYIGQVWPGRTAFPDFVKEETRRWWGRLNAEHVKCGLAGIWNDMNEPATGKISALPMRFDRDGANYPHARYRNQYAMLMAMGTVHGLKAAMPGMRTFILSRAGFAGMQRYAANWTGDNVSCWEHLAMSVYMNANLGLSGQPFVGSDVGGFCGDTNEELLIRWYQYGIFQPFLRNHSCNGTADQYPWSFGDRAETIIRQALLLRYRLLPYTYTAFMDCHRTAMPVQRPLVFDYQEDPTVRDNTTEFMFGPHLLVAPVCRPGVKTRACYLPAGEWYDFHTGRRLQGSRRVRARTPLDRIPIYVKAGAIVPMAEPVRSTLDYAPEELILQVYVPGHDGVFESRLYEDDGLTERYMLGEYIRTDMTCVREGRRLCITGAVSGQGVPDLARRQLRVRFAGAPLDDVVLANSGESFTLDLELPASSTRDG